MQTTWQRLRPIGPGWDQKFLKGSMDKNISTWRCAMVLLDRAVTLYWERRPDPRELSEVEDMVAV